MEEVEIGKNQEEKDDNTSCNENSCSKSVAPPSSLLTPHPYLLTQIFSSSPLTPHPSRLTQVFLPLLIATIAIIVLVERYQPLGPGFTSAEILNENLEGWNKSGDEHGISLLPDGIIKLTLEPGSKRIDLTRRFSFPAGSRFVRVSAEAASQEVMAADKPWHRARILFQNRDRNNVVLKTPYLLTSLNGSQDWQRYDTTFTIHERMAFATLVLQINHAPGSFLIRNIRLEPVGESGLFAALRVTVLISWALFFILCSLPYLKNSHQVLTGSSICLIVLTILIGTLIPGSTKATYQGYAKESVARILHNPTAPSLPTTISSDKSPFEIYLGNIEISKVGHFAMFGILTLILMLHHGKTGLGSVLAKTTSLAGVTELLQFFSEGRTPGLDDFGLDLAGMGLGLLLWMIMTWVRSEKTLGEE
ncbi:MAG: VanZ family protein [Proteobacteria bacterium]|nr:VanZ family protein [Pseudomonadota bacterium]MBU1688204.1 VanZ family protein [Pseudomonadota bacterium]